MRGAGAGALGEDERANEQQLRWMCSFDTTEADVTEFAAAILDAVRTPA